MGQEKANLGGRGKADPEHVLCDTTCSGCWVPSIPVSAVVVPEGYSTWWCNDCQKWHLTGYPCDGVAVSVAPEGGPRRSLPGAERGPVHRQGGGLPLTPEAVGKALGTAAAGVGFTLFEAAALQNGATTALRKVAGWWRRGLEAVVGVLIARKGWKLREPPMPGRWNAERTDGVASVHASSPWVVLRTAWASPVDWSEQVLRRSQVRRAIAEAQAWRALFARTLALAAHQRARVEAWEVAWEGQHAEHLVELSDAHDRAARAEDAQGKAEAEAEKLAVDLEAQEERLEHLRAQVEHEQHRTNKANTRVSELEADLEAATVALRLNCPHWETELEAARVKRGNFR